jgi:secreted trypsin-like serine protease
VGGIACLGMLMGAGSAAAAHGRGRQVRPQIVGGQSAPTGSLPQLAFIVDQVSASEAYLCTGTVLSANVVLTAGHCAEDETTGALEPASGFHVVTSRLDWSDTSVGQVSDVSQVIVDPSYNPTTHVDDVALLVLSTPTTAPAITLANSSDLPLWQPPTEVEIAGWGLTDGSDPDSLPTQLQWATTVNNPPATADCRPRTLALALTHICSCAR